ncbi:hypothetical protein FHS69_002224 [Erythrobacter flavus]|nr:hypothetical protein [Qipengyuania flava]
MTQRLDPILDALSHEAPGGMRDDFMEGVWERVGELTARRDRTMRSFLFAGLLTIGLGAGALTVQAPGYSEDTRYTLLDQTRLSPADLLHVSR